MNRAHVPSDHADQQIPITVPEARASSSLKDDHTLQMKKDVVSLMCTKLGISGLLEGDDVTTHPEFMDVLYQYSIAYNAYAADLKTWEAGAIRKIKRESKIKSLVHESNQIVKEVKEKFVEMSNVSTTSGPLNIRLKSCQVKMDKMMKMIPVLKSAVNKLKAVKTPLKMNIRAQKQHNVGKVVNKTKVELFCSNNLDITWDVAKDKISELIQNGRDDTRSTSVFTPLTGEHLILFCDIRESLFSEGNCCITSKKLQSQFELSDTDSMKAMHQIIEHCPVLAVMKSNTMLLIDSHELTFQPNAVYDLLTMDEENCEATQSEDTYKTKTSVKEGIFFYKRTKPRLQVLL